MAEKMKLPADGALGLVVLFCTRGSVSYREGSNFFWTYVLPNLQMANVFASFERNELHEEAAATNQVPEGACEPNTFDPLKPNK